MAEVAKVNKFGAKKVVANETNKTAKVAAGKPAAAKEPKAPKEKAEAAPDTRKITLITKENPKREGSESHSRFALYKNNMKVIDFIEAGGTAGDLRHDEKKGHIKVA